MCSVSAVSDYYMNTYPIRLGQLGGGGSTSTMVIQQMDPEAKELLRKAIALLDKLDKRLGDIECMDDLKAAFMAELAKKNKRKPVCKSK